MCRTMLVHACLRLIGAGHVYFYFYFIDNEFIANNKKKKCLNEIECFHWFEELRLWQMAYRLTQSRHNLSRWCDHHVMLCYLTISPFYTESVYITVNTETSH